MLFACCVSGLLCDVIGLRQTAFMGGVLCVVGFASSAFVTQLQHLFVTYGVILGCGFGLLYSPLVAISGHYFSRRLGLVNGIVTFGPSAFTMGLSFALPVVLKEFGLRNTLLGFSGFGLTIAVATLSWKPLVTTGNKSRGKECDGDCPPAEPAEARRQKWKKYILSKFYDPDLWRNKAFVVWCLAIAVGRFGYMEPNFHLVNHVSSLLPSHNASILVTVMAGTSGAGKLIFGLVSDFLRNYRIALQQGALLAYGAILLLLPLCSDFVGFLAVAVSFGLADALIMVLYGPNVVDLVGPGRTSQAFGFMSLLSIPGFLSAPAITGRLHDELGQYDAGFYLAGGLSVLAAVIMVFVKRSCVRHSAKADLTANCVNRDSCLTSSQLDHAKSGVQNDSRYATLCAPRDPTRSTKMGIPSLEISLVRSHGSASSATHPRLIEDAGLCRSTTSASQGRASSSGERSAIYSVSRDTTPFSFSSPFTTPTTTTNAMDSTSRGCETSSVSGRMTIDM